jgi:hypothetical protein
VSAHGELLRLARRVLDERDTDYGDGRLTLTRIAAVWTELLGVVITPRMVCLLMISLKVVRDSVESKADNLVDIVGYADLAHSIITDRSRAHGSGPQC